MEVRCICKPSSSPRSSGPSSLKEQARKARREQEIWAAPQATHGHGQQTVQRPTRAATFHAVSPLSNVLCDDCAYCGKEIKLPGFVILDFEESILQRGVWR